MSRIIGRCSPLPICKGNLIAALSSPKPVFCSSYIVNSSVTPESNPQKHTLSQLGLFYKIDNSLSLDLLFKSYILSREYQEECKTFNGTYIMIRKPALEIIHYLQNSNYDYPVNKYVLYGKRGFGVTMTMLHLIHWANVSNWLIVHVPSILHWVSCKTERIESTSKKGLLDLPTKGSAWLSFFKNQNLHLLNKLDLRLQNNYVWNIQEENKKGESLINLVDQGIARGKYSCEVIMALLEEVKLLSKSGMVKTLVAIDNFSVIFHPKRKSSNKKFKHIAPSDVSFMESFKDMAKPDWNNGAVVLACHSESTVSDNWDHLPLNKLSREGTEFLDPFVPVEVPEMSDSEMNNLLDFYRSQKWLLTSEGDTQIKTLSASNFGTLQRLCGPL